MILGYLGGIGVDFVACELCGTTRYIRTTMNKLLNVNLPPYYENDRNSQIFQYYKALKSLALCNRSTTHFTVLKYQVNIQSASRQSANNNLQLCYQRYLTFQLLSSQASLKTRKQNYIIIFTSLSGSLIENCSQ